MFIGNRFWGNELTEDVRGYIGQDVSMRFTVHKTGIIKKFEWLKMWGVEAGTPDVEPKFRLGFQEDVKGSPSGTWLSYKDLGGVGRPSVGWTEVSFDSPLQVEAEKIYHVVFRILQYFGSPNVPIVLEGFRVGGYFEAPECSFIRPKTQKADTAMCHMRYDRLHEAWIPFLQTPEFLIVYDDNSVEGQPYNNIFYFKLGKTSTAIYAYAQRFPVVSPVEVERLTVWIIKRGTPNDDLYLSVYDENDKRYLIEDLLAMKRTEMPSGKWLTIEAKRKVLLQNHVYRLEWRSPNTVRDADTYIINTYSNYSTLPEVLEAAYFNGFLVSKDNITWNPFFTGIFDSTFFLS